MIRLLGQLRGDPDAGRAGADEPNPLAREVDALVGPLAALGALSPAKLSMPLMSGTFAADRAPRAAMRKRAETTSPESVRISQRFVSSSKVAPVTRVPRWMSRFRSNLS